MANEAKISIKVLVDKQKNRVVFAEADYNFVDVLFSFMTLPMGAIVRLLGKKDDKKFKALGSLTNLYQSVIDLPVSHLFSEEGKMMLLNPRSSSYNLCRKIKLNIDDTEPTKYFVCEERKCYDRVTGHRLSSSNTTKCIRCRKLMNQEVRFKYDECVSSSVFVSDITTFIVTDDLCVMPYTLESCIQLIRDVGISDASRLDERIVDISREEVLALLGLALSSNCPLTCLLLNGTSFQGLVHSEQINFNQSSSIENKVISSPKMSLHVVLQKSTGKVLFAEGEEDIVDFIFSFLAIPLGGLIGTLLNGASSFVCMDNIFRSVLNLSKGRYLKSQDIEDILSKPYFGYPYPSKNHIFPLKFVTPQIGLDLRVCASNWWDASYLIWKMDLNKPILSFLAQSTVLVDPRVDGDLFKRSGMYMVTDDLVVTPSSSASTMDNLKKLKISLFDIEKHKVSIGMEEGIKLLKASLSSSSVLTSALEDQLKKLNPNF